MIAYLFSTPSFQKMQKKIKTKKTKAFDDVHFGVLQGLVEAFEGFFYSKNGFLMKFYVNMMGHVQIFGFKTAVKLILKFGQICPSPPRPNVHTETTAGLGLKELPLSKVLTPLNNEFVFKFDIRPPSCKKIANIFVHILKRGLQSGINTNMSPINKHLCTLTSKRLYHSKRLKNYIFFCFCKNICGFFSMKDVEFII